MFSKLLSIFFLCLPSVFATQRHVYWFSDMHLDNEYRPGAPDLCALDSKVGITCCRWYNLPIHGSHPASGWGDYHCDSPPKMVSLLMNLTKSDLFPLYEPHTLLFTGDIVDHHDVLQSFSHNMHEVEMGTNRIRDLNVSHTIMVIGNHDTWPIDQVNSHLTHHLLGYWGQWIPSEQVHDFLEGGYYVVQVTPGLRAIVMNNLYDDTHDIVIGKAKNPGNQTSWLEASLLEAKAQGQKVWLVGHIPPNTGEADVRYRHILGEMTKKYGDIIVGQLFGHTHRDSFFLYLNSSGETYGSGLITPSIVPDRHDPSLRILTFDDETLTLLNYQVYIMNLTTLIQEDKAELTLLYDACETYGLDDLTTPSMTSLWETLKTNHSLAEVYLKNFYVGSPQPCDDACLKGMIGSIGFPL